MRESAHRQALGSFKKTYLALKQRQYEKTHMLIRQSKRFSNCYCGMYKKLRRLARGPKVRESVRHECYEAAIQEVTNRPSARAPRRTDLPAA